jgi:hypothetical protein
MILPVIWLAFTGVFAVLAWHHWRAAAGAAPPFVLLPRPMEVDDPSLSSQDTLLGEPFDEPLKRFVSQFNQYVESQNVAARRSNLLAMVGYLAGAATALLSLFLTLPEGML